MKLFELTTGLIAAVMIALGASYYVNKNATIEEESVVVTNKAQQQCTGNFIWFEVKAGEDITCGDLSSVDPNSLILHEAVLFDPLLDMASWTTSQNGASSQTGCPTEEDYNCAVGYAIDANNFELSPDGEHWQPKEGVTPECTVCRSTP